jgi:hypothetical protein
MAAKVEALLDEGCIPAVSRAYGAGVLKKALRFLDPGELGELGMKRMLGVKERFFPVQDRRVSPIPVILETDLEGLKMHGHRRGQGRVRVVLEIRIA